eukprot:TRINITY_DN31017_c0_g1_i1.p1 TRINITY_DN31017_c0_g1~~TRINITY_DN31017_c0_g1_i1.p1  ORF type:complete len:631 (-),score=98.87 TRINITY_DN31017_c0_g1_i1:62-1954(-)
MDLLHPSLALDDLFKLIPNDKCVDPILFASKLQWTPDRDDASFEYCFDTGERYTLNLSARCCSEESATQKELQPVIERLARACFAQFELGKTVDQVHRFRDTCYARIKECISASSEAADHVERETLCTALADSSASLLASPVEDADNESNSSALDKPPRVRWSRSAIRAVSSDHQPHISDALPPCQAGVDALKPALSSPLPASSKFADVYTAQRTAQELRGDEVFRQPCVQALLRKARAQVAHALSEQPASDTKRWLICIRSYGRAGNPEDGSAWTRRSGIAGKGLRHLTIAALERALGSAKAKRHCLIFVSHEDDDVLSGRYLASLRGTPWEQRIVLGVRGADLQARFIEESAPRGTHIVIADDNITQFLVEQSCHKNHVLDYDANGRKKSELVELIERAGKELQTQRANLWGVNPSTNPLAMYSFGQLVRKKLRDRRRSQPVGPAVDTSSRLGLVYGAFFGIRAMQSACRYTRHGQVKDDIERTLRYWHCDGVVVRFLRYGVLKAHRPGMFCARKGGISALSSHEAHQNEGTRALRAMIDEFAWRYVRLAAPGERSSCGLVWRTTPPRVQAGLGSDAGEPEAEEAEEALPEASTATASPRGPLLKRQRCDAPQAADGDADGETGIATM